MRRTYRWTVGLESDKKKWGYLSHTESNFFVSYRESISFVSYRESLYTF